MKTIDIDEDVRIDEILEQIIRLASGECDYRGEISEDGDKIDAIIVGLNMLAEEIESYTDEIKALRDKSEESDRLKSTFLNNMSHEIRTPISIIYGYAEILKESKIRKKESRNYLDLISDNSEIILKTFNDIIDMSSLELNIEKVYPSKFLIADVVNEIYFDFISNKVQKKKSHIEFKLDLDFEKQYSITTDKSKLERLLKLLLDNALKFTNTGYIELAYARKKNNHVFSIKDTGIGIDKKQKKVIFHKFRQADELLSRKYDGVGLGLSISKHLVELLGGKIWVESEPGEGSTFSFSVPIDVSDKKNQKKKTLSFKGKEINNLFENITLLIAEDSILNYYILQTYLKPTNAKIVHVTDGVQAVDYCKKNLDVDAVIMDIQLPMLNGIEATTEIKKIRPDVPVIFSTANAVPENRDKSLQAGGNAYLIKPIKRKELIMTILNCLDK